MNIINLQVSNFMRISAVEIHPNGVPVIQITGKNAEGKSSVLDAIWAALAWRAAAGSIPEPIRRGQESAKVRIDLGDLVITRTWKGDKTTLQVTTRDGAKYSSPQSILDKLVSEIGFDPLEFCRMQPRDQRATLMNLLKIDFSQFDQERAGLLQKKNLVDNQITGLNQQLRDIPEVPEDVPDQEVSAGELIQQIQEAQHTAMDYDHKLEEISRKSHRIDEICNQIIVLEKELHDIEREHSTLVNYVDSITVPEIQPLRDRLYNIEIVNTQVRQKQQKSRIIERLEAVETDLEDITQNISSIDQDKKDALASAQFPVDGLSFDESGILLNGVSFAQASTAEQIRVSLAMGIALNPDLRVLLIRDGSALDSDSLKQVSDMAQDADMQIWVERVDESGQVGICIEDGTVKAPIPPGQQVIS